MRNRLAISLFLLAGLVGTADASPGHALPADLAKILHEAKQVELYSLEPWFDEDAKETKWHGFVLLGHATLTAADSKLAVAALDSAIKAAKGGDQFCFEPRHALRFESGGHKYDFLLSYECQQLEVFRDDVGVASLGAAGTPAALNRLLKAAKVPVSQSASD